MKKFIGILIVLLGLGLNGKAQSLEIMGGSQYLFADVQWLKTFDAAHQWSLFSRTRATVDYEGETDLFSGAYLNYTSKMGLGTSLIGRISTQSAGVDAGIHYFKASKNFMVFGLFSMDLNRALGLSAFSIARYTPALAKEWKLYSSLELFSRFNEAGHVVSIQRVCLGLDRKGYQFGFALNLAGYGREYTKPAPNPGIFIRKQFGA